MAATKPTPGESTVAMAEGLLISAAVGNKAVPAAARQAKNIGGITAAQAARLRELLTKIPGVEEVYVFGSRTKGTWTAQSDLDVAAFGNVNHSSNASVKATREAQA